MHTFDDVFYIIVVIPPLCVPDSALESETEREREREREREKERSGGEKGKGREGSPLVKTGI